MSKRKSESDKNSILRYCCKQAKVTPVCENEGTESELSIISAEDVSTSQEVSDATDRPTETVEVSAHPLDISNFVNRQVPLTDVERYNILLNAWKPDINYKFPIVTQNNKNRCFQLKWLDNYKWLCYSHRDQGGYCKVCVLFGQETAGRGAHQKLSKFVYTPLAKYKNALEEIKSHAELNYHKHNSVIAHNFLNTYEGKTMNVSLLMNEEVRNQVSKNRKKLIPIIKTVILCGRQNFPLRGHRDDGDLDIEEEKESLNLNSEGNFRALLRFRVDAGDQALADHLKTAPKNASYISKTSQNELIESCANVIREKILEKIKESKYYSILVDETTDVSTTEQLTFCCRFLDISSQTIREEFLGFLNVYNLTGNSLANTILELLENFGLNIMDLRGQGYDGGANMSGEFRGVQAYIREKQPKALYTHCRSHCLNLAICKACSLPAIRNAIDIINSVSVFARDSAKRMKILQDKVKDLQLESNVTKIKQLCETRWVEKHDAILEFSTILPAVINFLEFVKGESSCASTKANGIYSSIHRFEFIVSLNILVNLLVLTVSLSRHLQAEKIDLWESYRMVDNIINLLKDYRNNSEEKFRKIYQDAENTARTFDIDIKIPRLTGRQTYRTNIPSDSPEQYYRVSVYIPFLEYMISELETRFSKTRHGEILDLYGLIPVNLQNTDKQAIISAAKLYEEDLPGSLLELSGEFELWKLKWINEAETPSSALEAFTHATVFFPNIKVLLQILAILPVTTCSAERSFSSLRLIKNYLRSTMTENRLNGLALLYIHKNIAVDPEEVLEDFARRNSHRLQLKYM